MSTKISTYDPDYEILRKMLALEIVMKLEECGFEEEALKTFMPRSRPGRRRRWGPSSTVTTKERVFSRPVNENIRIKVYTTVEDDEVRHVGKDSIRVCAVYTNKDGGTRGLVKERRVHRTGDIKDIVDRMHQRMRDTWRAASSTAKCNKCGAPKFTSKKGNLVCAEVCWTKR